MDPQIDFGWQLYLPWRLSLGEHLGRDYLHAYGPLSSYFNAGIFKVFGVGVHTLVVTNLVVYAAIVALLYRVLHIGFGFWGAAFGTLVGLVVFGFGNHSWVWNYTYAAPYSHEATHGTALLLWLLWLLVRERRSDEPSGWQAGAVFGLICLTKVELVFAAAALIGAKAAVLWCEEPKRTQPAYWLSEAFAASGLLLAFVTLVLAAATDAATAVRVVTGGFLAPWLYSAYTTDWFSLSIIGFDHIGFNLALLVGCGAAALGYIILLTVSCRQLALRPASFRTAAVWTTLSFALVTFGAALLQDNFIRVGRAFPILMLAAGTIVVFKLKRELRATGSFSRRTTCQILSWAVAFALMARVMLAPRVYHYGFYLTMLTGVWLTAFITSEWPRISLPASRWRWLLRWELTATAAVAALFLLLDSKRHYEIRTLALGSGSDRIQGFSPEFLGAHSAVESTRKFITESTPKDATLVVIPEGIMLNYWSRRKHPLRIPDMLPSTLRLNGTPVLADMKKAAPDYVVLMTRIAGDEYAPLSEDSESRGVLDWVTQNYTVVARTGVDPLRPFNGKDFGVRVLRKNGGEFVATSVMERSMASDD